MQILLQIELFTVQKLALALGAQFYRSCAKERQIRANFCPFKNNICPDVCLIGSKCPGAGAGDQCLCLATGQRETLKDG